MKQQKFTNHETNCKSQIRKTAIKNHGVLRITRIIKTEQLTLDKLWRNRANTKMRKLYWAKRGTAENGVLLKEHARVTSSIIQLFTQGPSGGPNKVMLHISIVKPITCTNVSILFYFGIKLYTFRTVFPSIIRSSRLYIQQQAFVKLKFQRWVKLLVNVDICCSIR